MISPNAYRSKVPNVILVDTDPARTKQIQKILEANEHWFCAVSTGAAAMEYLQRGPLVVLVEPILPDMSGSALCRRISQDPTLDEVATALLANMNDAGELLAALESGADGFITKPVDDTKLLPSLISIWKNRRLFAGASSLSTADVLVDGTRRRIRLDRPANTGFFLCAYETALHHERALVKAEERMGMGVTQPTMPKFRQNPLRLRGNDADTDRAIRLALEVFRTTADSILVTDEQARIIEVNPAFCKMTGYAREEVLGRNPSFLKSGRHDAPFYRRMWQQLAETGGWQGEIWDRRRNGELYPKWLTINVTRGENGEKNYVGIASDITVSKITQGELEQMAHYDALTGLPNRVLFGDRLQQSMKQAARNGSMVALLFLDLDGFREINNTLGHGAGDAVLTGVGERIGSCLRANDTVARLGGDEFTVIVTDIKDAEAVALVAKKILDSFAAPFELESGVVSITTSIGAALYPQDALTREDLLANADAAMYNAKEAGKNRYRFYSAEMHAKAVARIALEAEIRQAVEKQEFTLHYQPIVETQTGRLHGMEALIRWNHPDGSLSLPGRFLVAAEQTRLNVQIDAWVMRQACMQHRAWLEQGCGRVPVAVNITSTVFEAKDFCQQVASILMETGVRPEDLSLELQASAVMRNPDASIRILLDLRDIGVRTALDDFGAGALSLNHLRHLPISTLKLERSLTRDFEMDAPTAAIVKAIIPMGQSLGMQIVAKGVESVKHLRFLQEGSCDFVQGYLVQRPAPPDQIAEQLREKREWLAH